MRFHRWLAVSVVALGAAFVQAAGARPLQATTNQDTNAPQITEREAQGLGLSDEQKNRLKEIRKHEREQIQAVRNDSSLTPEQKKQRIREIQRHTQRTIWGTLTPEQRDRAQQRRREHRRDAGRNPNPNRRSGSGRKGP